MMDAIDKVLNHRWLSMLTSEQNAILMGCRAAIVEDDVVVGKIVAKVGPYTHESQSNLTPDKELEGQVTSVLFVPKTGGLLILDIVEDKTNKEYKIWLVTDSLDSNIKVDGVSVDYPNLVAWLVANAASVKL